MKKLLAFFLSLLILLSFCTALAEYTDAETILAVQQALTDAGYYKGNISGIKGNATEAAIRNYQTAKGLKVSGQIDDELLAALGIGEGTPAAEQSAAPTQQGTLSFTVTTNKKYGTTYPVLQNEAITVYLEEVSFTEKNMFGENIMTVSFSCEMNESYFPKTSGYAASGDIKTLKVGGVSTKTAYHLSDGLMDYYGMGHSLQYPFENPGKQPVDIEIDLKSGRNNPNKFDYKIGPIHIEIEGDIYDGVDEMTAEVTENAVDLSGLMHNEPVTLIDQNGIILKAIGISNDAYRGDLNIELSASNENAHPVSIDMVSSTHPTPNSTKYIYAMLNGQHYYYDVRSANVLSSIMILTIPANMQSARYTLVISEDETPVPTLEELKNGQLTFLAYMATTEDLEQEEYYKWPELFNINPLNFKFDAAAAAVDSDAMKLPFPKIVEQYPGEYFCDPVPLFNVENVEMYVWDGFAFAMGERFRITLQGTLKNNTDSDLTVSMKEFIIGGSSADGRLTLRGDDGNTAEFIPANSEMACVVNIALPAGMDIADLSELGCTLRYFDVNTEKNILLTRVTFEVADDAAASAAASPAAPAEEGAITLPYRSDYFIDQSKELLNSNGVMLDYDYTSMDGDTFFIAGNVTNNTDVAITFSVENVDFDGKRAFAMLNMEQGSEHLTSVPAHSDCGYDIFAAAIVELGEARVEKITCTIKCTNADTGATIFEQPLTFAFQ